MSDYKCSLRSCSSDIDWFVKFTEIETKRSAGEVTVLDEGLLVELDLTKESQNRQRHNDANVRKEPVADLSVPRHSKEKVKALAEEAEENAFGNEQEFEEGQDMDVEST